LSFYEKVAAPSVPDSVEAGVNSESSALENIKMEEDALSQLESHPQDEKSSKDNECLIEIDWYLKFIFRKCVKVKFIITSL